MKEKDCFCSPFIFLYKSITFHLHQCQMHCFMFKIQPACLAVTLWNVNELAELHTRITGILPVIDTGIHWSRF